MATQTARQYTEQDIAALTQVETALRDAGMDIDNPKCIYLISDYLQANPQIPVTYENVIAFVNANNTQFVWLSAAQREYNKVAAENPSAAHQFATWFNVQTQLVKTGDEGFINSALLLAELRGRDAGDRDRIREAIGRIGYRGGRQLTFVPTSQKRDPRSHTATDDGKGFLHGANKSPLDYRREMNEAAEKNNPAAPPTSSVEAAAKAQAGSLRGNTHSETEMIQRVFATNG